MDLSISNYRQSNQKFFDKNNNHSLKEGIIKFDFV